MSVEVDAQTIKNLIANYSRPYEACIRELAMNAWEAHLAAGKPEEPFDIHMPTKLEPWFSVTDTGIGLSEDDMYNLYGCIGKSSKRDSNDFTGAFGIGALSPYAISDIFTVESIFNGKRCAYVCHLDKDGIPCISESPTNGQLTNEHDGFKVSFDVTSQHFYKFIEAAKPALANFKVTPNMNVHIEWDARPPIVEGDFYKVFEKKSQWGRADYQVVVMGQIAYPADINRQYNCELHMPVGSVDINSSRETLLYSDRTRAAIADYTSRMTADISTKIEPLLAKEDCEWNKCLKSKEFERTFSLPDRKLPRESLPEADRVEYRAFSTGDRKSIWVQPIGDVNGGLKFVIDDIPRGAITRCQDLKSTGFTVLIAKADEAKALKQFGILKKHLIYASSLPKPVIRRSSSGVRVGKIQQFHRYRRSMSESWSDVDPAALSSNAVYCDINRYKITFDGQEMTPGQLSDILEWVEIYETPPIIYGVKKRGQPDQKWQSLEDWLAGVTKKHFQKYVDSINAENISHSAYKTLSKYFDLSSITMGNRQSSQHVQTLNGWFKLPEPTKTPNKWKELMDELFFYNCFSGYLRPYSGSPDPKMEQAFLLLCEKFVTTFKLRSGL
jgi:hypothetical protein